MSDQIQCCVAGINGYVGQVLLKLIASHPNLAVSAILAKEPLSLNNPACQGVPVYSLNQFKEVADSMDVLLLATPADVSIEVVDQLKDSNLSIIDLSGAFRLSTDQLQQWYGLSHQLSHLNKGAPYGLSPYLKPQLGQTKLIANPGCYATGALLTLLPLLQNNIIDPQSIIIDAKSGVSGAGRKAKSDLMFCEIADNFMPYKVGKHQHLPEMKKCLSDLTGNDCQMTFVTQLIPIKSGIAMTIYCQANQKWIKDTLIAQVINEVFQQAYQDYPLLQFGQLNQGDDTFDKSLLSLNSVVNSPNIQIGFYIEKGTLCFFTCLDNLWKGAASQAIENINTLYQLPVNTGLHYYQGGL
ncbi:N-acetyl-gamma-glutamyl-phosphate reductase [Legionella sp. W05-934-2]|uniref:N-acetyl-gamma-glutamyl-phosphate reductase n=1 Tax=Legionella sp. W05-934-2 TaxID=1198649 RepID=UPI0034625C15